MGYRLMKYETTPILLALTPVLIQISAILILVLLNLENVTFTIFAIIISLIWLKMAHDEIPQELGELRTNRQLFMTIGEWFDQNDAGQLFDDIQSKYSLLENSVESEETKVLATASGIANVLRELISFLLQVYLLVVIVLVVVDSLGLIDDSCEEFLCFNGDPNWLGWIILPLGGLIFAGLVLRTWGFFTRIYVGILVGVLDARDQQNWALWSLGMVCLVVFVLAVLAFLGFLVNWLF